MKVEFLQENRRCTFKELDLREVYAIDPDSGELYCKLSEKLAINLNTMSLLTTDMTPRMRVTRVSKSIDLMIEASTQTNFGQLPRHSVFRTAGKIYKKVNQMEAVYLKRMSVVNFSADIKVTVVEIDRVEVNLK